MPEQVAQPTRADQRFVSDVGSSHQQEIPIGAITGDCVLGLAILTTEMQVSLPKEKWFGSNKRATQLHSKAEVPIRKLATFAGMAVVVKQGNLAGLLHCFTATYKL